MAHPTQYGTHVSIKRHEANIMSDGSLVISKDIVAYNGVMHVIDQVSCWAFCVYAFAVVTSSTRG